jgi:hypothetical protein
MDTTLIAAIITALGTIAAALITALVMYRKSADSDGEKTHQQESNEAPSMDRTGKQAAEEVRRELLRLEEEDHKIEEAPSRTRQEVASEPTDGTQQVQGKDLAEGTEHDSLQLYQQSVQLAWADGKLHAHELEWLRDLANRVELDQSTAADVEHKVMGDTKEGILESQQQAASEEELNKQLNELVARARTLHRNQEGLPTFEVGVERQEVLENRAETTAMFEAFKLIMDKHLSLVMEVREHVPVSDADLLSNNIVATVSNNEIGLRKEVSNEIARLHGKVNYIIEETAARLEGDAYKRDEEGLNKAELSYRERDRARALMRAENSLFVSLRAVTLAWQVLAHICEEIRTQLAEVEAPNSVNAERIRILANAILLYETTDFLIDYIENLRIQGLAEFNEVHADTVTELNAQRVEIEELKREATVTGISEETRQEILASLGIREETVNNAIEGWDVVIHRSNEIEEYADNIGATYISRLKLTRRNFKSQITGPVSAVTILSLVNQTRRVCAEFFETHGAIRVERLSLERIIRLLAIYG